MAVRKRTRNYPEAVKVSMRKATEERKAANVAANKARQAENQAAHNDGLMTPWEAAQSQRKAKRLGKRQTLKRAALVPGAVALVNRRQGIYASFKPVGTDPKTRANREQAKAAISEIVAKAAA